jgi:hypothetical protein
MDGSRGSVGYRQRLMKHQLRKLNRAFAERLLGCA